MNGEHKMGYYCIRFASLFGLMVGNNDNPFDLIDEPPRYEQSFSSSSAVRTQDMTLEASLVGI